MLSVLSVLSVLSRLQQNKMYHLYGDPPKRWYPNGGPATIMYYRYPGQSGGDYFDFADSRTRKGAAYANTIPPDKVAEVQAMWDKESRKQYL